METMQLDSNALDRDSDWIGNNAAFRCPLCRQTFIVSGRLHPHGRKCPRCEGSTAYIKGGRKAGGTAFIEWTSES